MKSPATVTVLGLGLLLAAATPAWANNYFGKLTLVQTNSAGTRFFVRPQSLSLFAVDDHRDVLLNAFFRQSNVSISYTTIACPGGITGTCGRVNFTSVDVTNLTP